MGEKKMMRDPKLRDPKIDPKRGDVLARPRAVRVVLGCPVMAGGVGVAFPRGSGLITWVYIDEWRRWAKSADVLMRAEERNS